MRSCMEPSCYVDLRQIIVISCLYLWGFCLKVAQQAVECLLVGIMDFPRAKITDIAFMTNIGSPSERTIENCLVQPDRKKDSAFLFPLLGKSSLHLVFHPSTCYRVLRENK